MSKYLDRVSLFQRVESTYSNGWGAVTNGDRRWEDAYRGRWAHDKVIRSTHGVNCTGSCSWKIHVKSGVVVWETQQTDYPRTPADMPNHEPRGCPRGASFSWYIYSANRIKHPMIRRQLLEFWRAARKTQGPVDAWAGIVGDAQARRSYQSVRGFGGLVRLDWDEALEIVAAANVHTIKTHGPDRVAGFSPIPAYSLVSYGCGTRYLSLIGGTILSFYDWYCDLPPSSPQVWGEQTDVPESLAWYRSSYIIVWGTNISMTRTPDAHFLVEARYNGTKVAVVGPDYVEVTKNADWWLHPKQGTDAALAMAMSHVVLKEFHLDAPDAYFQDYARRFTDLPMLVRLERQGERWVATRTLRASDLAPLAGAANPEWKTLGWDEIADQPVVPQGSIGFRWHQEAGGDAGKWNLEAREGVSGAEIRLALSLIERRDDALPVAFPYFGGVARDGFPGNDQGGNVLTRNVPVKRLQLVDGEAMVATVFDLLAAHLAIDRGLGGGAAHDYDDDVPYTPAWQERITGVKAADAITLAREFAANAAATRGRSSVLMGAGVNQWYNTDNTYRSIINLLLLCGTCGVPGGGWCHYVGQEKIRPTAGWATYSFALDWTRPSRQMNSTSYFYAHTDQWRYEKMPVGEFLSPLADASRYQGTFIDCNVRAERMGWLPSSPQLKTNPLAVTRSAAAAGVGATEYALRGLRDGSLAMSCVDPDAPENWPRNLFVWRSNLLGSSGKGHEYFLKHLLGTQSGILGPELGAGDAKPEEVVWHDSAPDGKLDLLVTLDFRMSTTALYSDIVLPSATFYEKNDLNTTDMHSFIHPFVKAVDSPWEARSDFEIFKAIAAKFSELAPGHLGVEQDLVLSPLGHDTPAELGQALSVRDWKRGECEPEPGRTAPAITVVERDYSAIHAKFTAVGPLIDKLGMANKGLHWPLEGEIGDLVAQNGAVVAEGVAKGRPAIDTDIAAAEMILALSPETNGAMAVRSWATFKALCGQDGSHLSASRAGDRIRFHDLAAQPRKVITGADWSGIESEKEPYVAFWTNVNLGIPWRTLTGRQQFYQDHQWLRDFGQAFALYRPPIDARALAGMPGLKPNGQREIALNLLTTHQKWGIHSTFYDNERMLTLSRGGPLVWINEDDARRAGIADNDWIEAWNVNGALVARAIVSQRLMPGMCIMAHATEKTINTPGSELTGTRGGIHNSATRVVLNPTHMVGGYAQLAYGFNYYGTIGANRDEFVVVRKMTKVDWMEEPAAASGEAAA